MPKQEKEAPQGQEPPQGREKVKQPRIQYGVAPSGHGVAVQAQTDREGAGIAVPHKFLGNRLGLAEAKLKAGRMARQLEQPKSVMRAKERAAKLEQINQGSRLKM